MLHCDLLSSILKYEVSTWLKNKVRQWLLPLTSKCISVFLLECSDFWGAAKFQGEGASLREKVKYVDGPSRGFGQLFGQSKTCTDPPFIFTSWELHENKDSATPLLICAFHKPLNVNVSKHEPFLYRTQNMMNVLVRSLSQKLLHRCHIIFFHSI